MNRLLERQLKKFFGGKAYVQPEYWPFLNAVSRAYDNYDSDLKLMERSFDLSSEEMATANRELEELFKKSEKAKEELEASEYMLQKIIDGMPFGIIVIDKEKIIIKANSEAARLAGYGGADELPGKLCHTCLCPAKEGECPILDLGQEIDREERVLITKTGETISVLKSVVPVTIRGREVLLETFVDLSERKKAEEEKNNLERQLLQAQKLETIGTLAGGIAHDFNNLLSLIFGYAELIKKHAPPGSPTEKNIKRLIRAGRYGRDLVKQILTFSRQTKPAFNNIRLQKVLDESLKLMRASLPSYIKIEKHIDRSCPDIKADETQIKQVIANLCTNAGHAMHDEGGVLSVRLSCGEFQAGARDLSPELQAGEYIVLEISDTGCGMDPETKEHVFEPFYTTRNRKYGTEGIGLGLSVSHGIIKQHNGAIMVYSSKGQGTTFRIYLPTSHNHVSGQTGDKSASFSPGEDLPVEPGNILFVDDDESIIVVSKEILESSGYKVVGIIDAGDALDTFRADPSAFDLVITDQVMPRITGSQLAKEILNIRPEMPIILTTGYTDTISDEDARRIGIKECLAKPIEEAVLLEAIKKAVSRAEN
jgi:PAS domain S-box-containing protein